MILNLNNNTIKSIKLFLFSKNIFTYNIIFIFLKTKKIIKNFLTSFSLFEFRLVTKNIFETIFHFLKIKIECAHILMMILGLDD